MVLLGQTLHVRPGSVQMVLCGVGAGLFGGKGIVLGLQLVEQLLHPLVVSGSLYQLLGTAAAGNEIQVFAGQVG